MSVMRRESGMSKKRSRRKYFGVWKIGVVEALINVCEQYVDKKRHSNHIHFVCKEWMSMCDTELREAGFYFDKNQSIEVLEMLSKIMDMKSTSSPELI
ncbi:hypothetical protein AAHA92_10459 [Salvia divinorum]|uniref:Uncharacterized protein n=1 Tax=Salvia divinorum TaxID=28513 RepID=A0ABD1HUT0_SALDI